MIIGIFLLEDFFGTVFFGTVVLSSAEFTVFFDLGFDLLETEDVLWESLVDSEELVSSDDFKFQIL